MQITKSPVEIKIKKIKDWDFIQLPGMAYKGLYSKKDIDAYKQSINEPLQQKANEINLFRALEGNSKLFNKYSIINAMKEEEWDGIKKSFLKVSWDWTKDKLFLFGNFSSMVFGGFLVFKTIKFLINMIFNFYLLNLTLGFSWRNCFAWWDSLTHFFVNQEEIKLKRELRENKKKIEQNIELNDKDTKETLDEIVIPLYHYQNASAPENKE